MNADFYNLDSEQKRFMLETFIGRGKCISITEGMCGTVYIFDQGEIVHPRYICAKVPKVSNTINSAEAARRFVNEIEKQLSFYQYTFVHWPFDFTTVLGAPVVLFRYWGSDLNKLIASDTSTIMEKLSIMVYICEGLKHCQSRGLISHQDLKPQNIFIRDLKPDYQTFPHSDNLNIPMIADFGLADAFIDKGVFDGARPYMSPEQWGGNNLSNKTDIFSLGVIFYQLLSNGKHPVGIKLSEFWPEPEKGNSKKWTRPEPWQKWACPVDSNVKVENSPEIDTQLLELVKKMLSYEPNERPDIQSLIDALLTATKQIDAASHDNIVCLIQYFKSYSSNKGLKIERPDLFKKWEWFKSEFGENS